MKNYKQKDYGLLIKPFVQNPILSYGNRTMNETWMARWNPSAHVGIKNIRKLEEII